MASSSSTQIANNTHSTAEELNSAYEKVYEEICTSPYQNFSIQGCHGSQKTTCFVRCMLNRVNPTHRAPQVLCVCSTKELAKCNQEFFKKNDRFTGITSLCAVWPKNAASIRTRSQAVNEQVIFGTPGIIKTWMSRGVLTMKNINTLVFDEADNILAQGGYKDDSVRIIKGIRNSQGVCKILQILLFSATCDANVENFATKPIIEAKKVVISSQYWVKFPNVFSKVRTLVKFLKIIELAEKPCQAIIFVKTRETATELHKDLVMKYTCFVEKFRSGLTKILIDLSKSNSGQPQVNMVFNFDPQYPPSGFDYERGVVFNFYTDQDEQEMHFEQKVPELIWNSEENFENVFNDEMKNFSKMSSMMK